MGIPALPSRKQEIEIGTKNKAANRNEMQPYTLLYMPIVSDNKHRYLFEVGVSLLLKEY